MQSLTFKYEHKGKQEKRNVKRQKYACKGNYRKMKEK